MGAPGSSSPSSGRAGIGVDLNSQLRLVLLTCVAGIPVLVLFGLLYLQGPVVYEPLLRDAGTATTVSFTNGMVTNGGVLVWWAAATIALFAAFLERSRPALDDRPAPHGLLLYFGSLTALLAVDDFFMLHETVFPLYLGVPELGVYTAYAVLVLGLVVFLPQIMQTPFVLLLIASGLLGLSVLTDVGLLPSILLVEELFKALGILTWLVYSASAARCLLVRTDEQTLARSSVSAGPGSRRAARQVRRG